MRKIASALMTSFVVALASPAMAQGAGDDYAYGFSGGQNWTLLINGTDSFTSFETGWVSSLGEHQTSNQNYIVGTCCFGSGVEFNNYAAFDLSGYGSAITSAVLTVNAEDVFLSVNRLYSLYDVMAPVSLLDAERSPGDAGGLALHLDLQSGPSFGNFLFTPSTPDYSMVSITLNSAGLAELQSSVGGNFVVGGSMNLPGIGPDPVIPEPATWLMMILGFGAVGASMRRRKQGLTVRYA